MVSGSVQQGHLSPRHQSFVCVPPWYQRCATAGRERRTIRMGSARCHLTCIISAAATPRQVVLHFDVVTHQQRVCQEARYRVKVTTYNLCGDAAGARGFGCWGLQRRCLAPPMRQRSKTHQYYWRSLRRYEPTGATCAPHHCEDQVRCRVNGLMCVGWSSHWTLMISDRYAYTVRSLSPTTPRVLVKRIKATHPALANARGDYAPQYHHDQRLHLKEASSPYDLNKERTRAPRAQSDHSRNSQVTHLTSTCSHEHNAKGPHNNVYTKALRPMTWWGIDSLFPLLLFFSDSCHTLHPRHIACRTAPAYMSRFFEKERNKHQHPTVLQNMKSFLWMLDCAWMEYLLSTFGIRFLKCYVQPTTLQDMVS